MINIFILTTNVYYILSMFNILFINWPTNEYKFVMDQTAASYILPAANV